MKTAQEEQLEEETLELAGVRLAVLLNLKQARFDDGTKRGKPYNPPRYHTNWGTKSALGLALSIKRVLNGEA